MPPKINPRQLTFSFVIPAYNEERHIRKTLQDIHTAFEPNRQQEFETILVDNGSEDQTVMIAESMECRCFVKPEMGISQLRNFGASVAYGSVIVFIDSDVSLTSTWRTDISPYLPHLLNEQRIVLGSHYRPNPDTPFPLRAWFVGQYQNPRATFLPGGHTIVHRKVFDFIGGFDSRFSTSEDIDFCHRATASGIEVRHCSDIGVIHMGDPSSVHEFLKRECWHGGSDFESIHRMLTSRTAWATLVFLLLHCSMLYFLTNGNNVGLIAAMSGTIGLSVTASFHLFPKSSIWLRITNSLNAYIYFLGRVCSMKSLIIKSRRN
jgi:glycosyltransferase involved in cell wall biosynthesis